MFRSLITLLILVFSTTLHAASLDYHRYHDSILAAERHIADGQFKAAAQSYRRIFNAYEFVFARDAYNAAQIAVLADNKPFFNDCVNRCGKAGVPKSLLSGNRLVQGFAGVSSATFDERYTAGEIAYSQRIDHQLREEIRKRYQLEQDSKSTPEYKGIVYNNFSRILQLAKTGRFPGEHLIGPNERLESSNVFATLCHYPYSYTSLKPWLTEGLAKGWIQPRAAIYLYGFNQTRTSVLYTKQIPFDTVNFKASYNTSFGRQSTDLAEVDRQRRLVQLHDIETAARLKAAVKAHGIDFREGY